MFIVTVNAPGSDIRDGHAAIQVLNLLDGSLSTLANLETVPVRLAVSDDARTVWAATQDWGILRLDVASGEVAEHLSETPSVSACGMLV